MMTKMMMMKKMKVKLFEMHNLENNHMALYRSPFMVHSLMHTSSFVLAALEKSNLLGKIDTGCLVCLPFYSKGLRVRSTHYSIPFPFHIFLASEEF